MLEYYLTIKKNEVLTHGTAWINLENSLLSERSQTKKATSFDSIYLKCPEEANL